MKDITQAIIKVMEEVKNIDKNTTVGAGSNTYKGVSDKDVKEVIRKSMAKNGLVILPKAIEHDTQIERWTEKSNYGEKQKQTVFTEVKTTYLLLHTSGQSVELQGLGHGVDSQDKGAGKATTYALKYALLYTFLVPTGHIDDADATHSDETPTPPAAQKATKASKPDTSATDAVIKILSTAKSVDELRTIWSTLSAAAQKDPEVRAYSKELSEKLAEPVIE